MLARDFFGIKPVYYAEIDGHFVLLLKLRVFLHFQAMKGK